jgi:hypothetical protein
MSFEFKENSGSLFPRVDKDNDRQPDATGRCKIDGRMYKIAAWDRVSSSGLEYQSMAFTPEGAGDEARRFERGSGRGEAGTSPEAARAAQGGKIKEPAKEPPKRGKLEYNDEIPF